MSFTAAHASKRARRDCQICRERKARFRYRGEVRADRDHVLCFKCYRSERNRRLTRMLVDPGPNPPLGPRFSQDGALSQRQVVHRHQMLQHLAAAMRR